MTRIDYLLFDGHRSYMLLIVLMRRVFLIASGATMSVFTLVGARSGQLTPTPLAVEIAAGGVFKSPLNKFRVQPG